MRVAPTTTRERRLSPAAMRVAGRVLSGVAMQYGEVSGDFNERFLPGAFGEVREMPINLQHDSGIIVAPAAALTDSPRALRVRATLQPRSAALALVRRGALNGFSVEFVARRERRDSGGIRVIESAQLTGLALVDRGAYPGATAEVRARSGRTLQQRIPSGRRLACECAGDACDSIEFPEDVLAEAVQNAGDALAVRSNYGAAVASAERGTVRARMAGGDAVVAVDLPTGPDGDAILRAIEDTGAVLIRPYLARESEGQASADGTMVYSRAVIRSWVIGATDRRAGWPEPELILTPDEYMTPGRAAIIPEDASSTLLTIGGRRLWL